MPPRRTIPCTNGFFRGRVNALVLVFAALFGPPSALAAEEIRVLAFGDSLTAGYGLPLAQSFPAQLERALRARGHAVTVLNGGVSGDTTAAGRARLDWSLADRPDAVIVELGANDGLRALRPAATFDNLEAILSRLDEGGIPVLLTGMRAPANLGQDYVGAFERVFTDLAARHDVIFYPFFLDGVAAMPELNQADGIHPTAEGISRIVDWILPSVEALLARVSRPGLAPASRMSRAHVRRVDDNERCYRLGGAERRARHDPIIRRDRIFRTGSR